VTVRELIEKLAQVPEGDDVYFTRDGTHVIDITNVVHVSEHGLHYVAICR
jgi:hypothetical protein